MLGTVLYLAFFTLVLHSTRRALAGLPVLVRTPRAARAPRPENLSDPFLVRRVAELEALGFHRTGVWLYEQNPGAPRARVLHLQAVLQDEKREVEATISAQWFVADAKPGPGARERVTYALVLGSEDAAGRHCVTRSLEGRLRDGDSPETKIRDLAARASIAKLVREHRDHLSGFTPVPIDPEAHGERILRDHGRTAERLVAAGVLAPEGDFLAIAPASAGRLMLGMVGLRNEGDAARARVYVVALAVAGALLAILAATAPEPRVAGAFLLGALTAATLLTARHGGALLWGLPAIPAALVLEHFEVASWPGWVAALLAAAVVARRTTGMISTKESARRRVELAALGFEVLVPPLAPETPTFVPKLPAVEHALALGLSLVVADLVWPVALFAQNVALGPWLGSVVTTGVALAGIDALLLALLVAWGGQRGKLPPFPATFLAAILASAAGEVLPWARAPWQPVAGPAAWSTLSVFGGAWPWVALSAISRTAAYGFALRFHGRPAEGFFLALPSVAIKVAVFGKLVTGWSEVVPWVVGQGVVLAIALPTLERMLVRTSRGLGIREENGD